MADTPSTTHLTADRVLETPHPANLTYFPALDGVRALAFLMVFSQHYIDQPWGWTGVDVFFVLSGFLITGILYDTRGQEHRARNFYIRRTLRIFPLYYGVMLLLLLTYPVFRWDWNWKWLFWPAYLGNFLRGIHPYMQASPWQLLADFQPVSTVVRGFRLNLGHFWSLCVEEQFYLFWPWVVFLVRDRVKLMRICLACVVVCPLLRIAGYHMLPQWMLDQEVLYRWTPFRVDALLLGGWVALVRRGPQARRLLHAARITFAAMFVVMIVWLALHDRHLNGNYVYPPWHHTWGLLFVDVLSACLIVMALEPGSIVFRIFNLRPLRWLGRISYGAYVYHDIFHPEIRAFAQTVSIHARRMDAALGLLVTLVLSWASYRWFETPFIKLKERWTRPLPKLEPEVVSAAGRGDA